MAHYAYLNEDNIVVAVTVGKDENELIDGLDPETYYSQGTPYTVKRTSYHGSIRKRFAGIGYLYMREIDAFLPPPCHDEAILNKESATWDCTNEAHTETL